MPTWWFGTFYGVYLGGVVPCGLVNGRHPDWWELDMTFPWDTKVRGSRG